MVPGLGPAGTAPRCWLATGLRPVRASSRPTPPRYGVAVAGYWLAASGRCWLLVVGTGAGAGVPQHAGTAAGHPLRSTSTGATPGAEASRQPAAGMASHSTGPQHQEGWPGATSLLVQLGPARPPLCTARRGCRRGPAWPRLPGLRPGRRAWLRVLMRAAPRGRGSAAPAHGLAVLVAPEARASPPVPAAQGRGRGPEPPARAGRAYPAEPEA